MKIKQRRFDNYNPYGDLGDPETTGTLPNGTDYDLGTPNMGRSENISLVAANSSLDQCLVLKIKWRPNDDGQTVTTISRLTFILEQNVYEFNQVESYKPSADLLGRPGRITEYGSSSSKLKLVIMSPYRRARIVFNGHVRHVSTGSEPIGSDQEPRLIYLKLSCMVLPTSATYDFYDQFDESCLKQIYNQKKLTRPFNEVVSDLVLHDRHEQRVRLNGEFLLIDNGRRQAALEIRGYHNRHFISSDEELKVKTARLYAFVNNGQGFHIGTRVRDSEQMDFGYTAFHGHPRIKFIEKPFEFEGNNLNENMEQFSLEISGQECNVHCTGEKYLRNWFKLEFNGKPGWAWLSLDDELEESPGEIEAMRRCREEQEQAIKLGKVCRVVEVKPDQKPLVVTIEDECCESSQLVGAKAASLAQLHRFVATRDKSDFRVPHAIVLTRFAHDLVLEENQNLREAIDELQQFLASGDLSNLQNECKKVQDLVSAASLPKAVADELWQSLESKYQTDEGATFAVRSSSWGEDEADMSAAGQLTTVLSVTYSMEEISRAVMVCFASKFSYENIEYKRQHGQPIDMPMAVVVQRMISCDKAGVMFTCDPTNGDETITTITANYGLGESVVSAQADPDSIKVRVGLKPDDFSIDLPHSADLAERSFTIEEVTVGRKELIIDNEDESHSHYDQYDKSKCCLSDEEILQLAKCGQEIKRYFWSQRRDIEWGYKGGQLHLFQSRPVTGLDSFTQEELLHELDKLLPGELNFYTRANVGEVMPYGIKPLSLSFSIAFWSIIGYRLRLKFLPNDFHYTPQVVVDFFYLKYHALFSCSSSMFLSLDSDEKSVLTKSLEIGFFGREIGPRPDLVESSRGLVRATPPFAGTRFMLSTWQLRLMPVRTVERQLPIMMRLREDIRDLKLAKGYESNKLLGLYNQMCAVTRYLETCWSNHIVVIVLATESNVSLYGILSKYIQDAKQLCAATNRFLAISPDVISAEIPKRVRKIAELVRARGLVESQEFVKMSSGDALEFLLNEANENKPLRLAFNDFMAKFGHRNYNEFELAEQAWRENPAQVVEMIQKNCSALMEEKEQKDDQRDKTIDDVIKSLGLKLTFSDSLRIRNLLAPKCQLMLSLREKTKNILVMFNDCLRESSRMLARELVRHQRIPDEDLLYYVAFDELKPLVLDYQPAVVMQAVKRRQLFKRMFSEVWKFDEIFSEVVPNHMKPRKEVDETIAQAPKLFGTPASSGKVKGRVCRVEGHKELDKVRPGTILLTHSTDIAFSPVFPMISGIITEVGGLVSHGAVVAREYGLPSLIGIPDVMRIIEDGEEIILDADNGIIIRLNKQLSSGGGIDVKN
uniref:Putative phosphoenolpyruvate synthase n=1 Tax=Aceria tosichella TaxID=561515 RepID=A0A6G1S5D7_9ACAR